MKTSLGSAQTNPLFDLHYVFEQRWGTLGFNESDILQLSGPQGDIRVQISFADKSQVLLGRAASSAHGDVDTHDDEADATLSTVSHEFRRQLLNLAAATPEAQQRTAALRNADLPLIDLRLFGADAHSISRKHAVLEYDGQYITLADLQSTNGTHLNGAPLFPMQRRILRDGDKLQLGSLQLRVHFGRVSAVIGHSQHRAAKDQGNVARESAGVNTIRRADPGCPPARC